MRVAFYLPQFYPTPENDAWHGAGFTEWTLVAQSRPLFPGHYQPHLPGELGFYDQRVPETRELQAHLARSHGITGFCYYHYWFGGHRMLERTFEEVLRSGKPDFPFCLCWANESWFRRWQGSFDEVVIEQSFDEQDDLDHIRWMIEAFSDPRYIRVKDRPLLTIYRPHDLPDPKRTVEIWREECARAGIPAPWLVGFETSGRLSDPAQIGFDASAEFVPHGLMELLAPTESPPGSGPGNYVYDYAKAASAFSRRPDPSWIRYPCVAAAWDNSPRRQNGEALVLVGSTPERYQRWLERAMLSQIRTQGDDGVVFLNAWNEWSEGAHLEPDVRYGRAYLEATREVVQSLGGTIEPSLSDYEGDAPAPLAIEDVYTGLYERFVQLQNRSSGLLAYGDRRVRDCREDYEKRLETLSAENRRLAEWALSLERMLEFRTRQLEELSGAGSWSLSEPIEP
jgi:hypothetical protein